MSRSGPENFFVEQFEKLEAFLVDPDRVLLRLLIDPEMRRMPLGFLAARDEAPDFPHLLLHFDAPFDAPFTWFESLSAQLDREIEAFEEDLRAVGAEIAEPATDRPDRASRNWERFLTRAENLTESLPDNVGSLAFLLEPETIADVENWQRAMSFLADRTGSQWLKFIVFEPRLAPTLSELEEHWKVQTQVFHISPEEIERRAEAVLKEPGSQ